MSKLVITIERVEEYQGYDFIFHPSENPAAKYVVSLNNGDIHLCESASEVKSLIAGELFLNGIDDAPAT